MKNELTKMFEKHNIKVVITNNKQTILSTGIEKQVPTVRVHKIFEQSSSLVYKAIFDYYVNYDSNALIVLQAHIKSEYPECLFKIKPPTQQFTSYINNIKYSTKISANKNQIPIKHIQGVNSNGELIAIHDNYIHLNEDDIIKIDIIVDNP